MARARMKADGCESAAHRSSQVETRVASVWLQLVPFGFPVERAEASFEGGFRKVNRGCLNCVQ